MKKEYFLKKGGTIGICAPSARFDLQKFNAGVKILKGLGYKVKIPKEIFEKKRYLAGNDILRADVINQLFSDPDIDGIICARGGFGAMRLLDHLNWDLINKNPKLFIGFSDITAILLSIMEKTDKAVIHGPTVVSIAKAQHKTIESFQRTIQGCFDEIKIANGFKNAVLFLEDIGEPAYKIDRMLSQLKMAGIFKGIAGVITGSFEKCDNSEYIEEILLEIFQEYNIPIVTGLDAGHGNINLSLSMGINIEIDTKTLTINWN
jgi:muramoyltetrapeptide carboxypeptidase